MTEKEGIVPGTALGISFQIGLGDGKQVVFQVHVDAEVEAEALNKVLDKIRVAGERQAAFSDIEQLEKFKQTQLDGLNNLDANLALLDEKVAGRAGEGGRRGAPKMTPKDEQDRTNALTTRKKFVEMIERTNTDLAKLRAITGAPVLQ